MINKENFESLLKHLGFEKKSDVFTKRFASGCYLNVDFKKKELQYPESDGLIINERQTCNFFSAENAVVFECVCKLLGKGYKPKHIELEPKWKLGHGASGGRADILVKDQNDKPLLIIECKTYGKEFNKAWKDTLDDGGQLFSYAQQIAETEFLCLYASEFDTKANNNKGQILVEQRIISHKDNEKILELGEQLKSYKKASNVKKRFDVWKETYQLEYTETGIFEENIQPYQIGKSNYTLDIDTRSVTEKDKEGKYHRFRTILRQHNIARKETAFEVLVNLFLAKIVDEEENKDNLEFYWKGVAYDNYYDFIDRLQKLYQIGMRKFLKDEVMYISSEQIDGAFWTVKNKKNATKKQIQKYFRDLKFFSNNAFSLINVHNERLFNRNTKVLVELVQMWQGLRLKTKEQNQFLGDMFEYFLDNSIKQSEGQFFTPMPITKFIVASLPLDDKIQKSTEPLKAIDYACGAGHFLTEYAHQIKPLVKKYKQTELSQYYENITGIEKEDRLAKIAKVSAYMYGQDQIKIIEEDALSDITDIKQANYDVLVANPPFAVEGFLLNLTDKQKENYELIKTTGLNSNTNNIQCFFLERAKQLMTGGGVVGVIVPSSILSNSDSTHIVTREVILKYFDIVALVELGSGTFGKTGTNTVVLFLKRKDKKPEPAEHYQNRVDDYFEGIKQGDASTAEYQDLYLIQKYCEHNELAFEEYKKLFGITAETISNIDPLLKTELFTEYKKDFDSSTDIKNLKKKKFFKDKSQKEKELELNKRFISSLYAIEKDKLFYFMLAYENSQKVLIVKSPSNNKQQKQFLGYEWSGGKGQEGIKYNGGSTVNDIITPLFNPKNIQDKTKINTLIEQNYLGNTPNDLSEFEAYKDLISYASVADILDFSRKDFNKAFSLTPKKNITIDTKWGLVRLGDECELVTKGTTPTTLGFQFQDKGINFVKIESISEMGCINEDKFMFIDKTCNDVMLRSQLKVNDILFSIAGALGRATIVSSKMLPANTNQALAIIRLKNDANILLKYTYNVLASDFIQSQIEGLKVGIAQPNLSLAQIQDFKIPLPPKEIQGKIVSECEVIDHEVEKAQQTIDETRNEVEEKVKEVFKGGYQKKKLIDVAEKIFAGGDAPKTNFSKTKNDEFNIPVFANAIENKGLYGYTNVAKVNKPSITISARGTLGYTEVRNEPFVPIVRLIVVTPNNLVNVSFLKNMVSSLKFVNSGSVIPQLTVPNIKNFTIPVPPMSEQKELVSQIEKLEQKINQAQEIIDKAPEKKQQILDKYLK